MSSASPFVQRSWMLVLLVSTGFLFWADTRRMAHVTHVATLTRGDSIPDAASPTGYRDGIREWVLPDRSGESYEWIALADRARATGEWRIRSVPEENAPLGRPTHATAPYRWWLSAVASLAPSAKDNPLASPVERAASLADPWLHLVLVLGFAIYVARRLGPWAAIGLALGLAFLFPLSHDLLPGAPDDFGLRVLALLGAVLPLVAALRPPAAAGPRRNDMDFGVAGFFAGCGVWLTPTSGVPIMVGVAIGGFLERAFRRPATPAAATLTSSAWRVWSLSGTLTLLFAYLFEYAPAHLGDWEIRSVHPFYGLAWLGLGELLALAADWSRASRPLTFPITWGRLLFIALALAAVPVAMARLHNPGFLLTDVNSFRLTKEAASTIAQHVGEWLRDNASSSNPWLTLLPFAIVVPGAVLALFRERRSAVALALGPVLVAVLFACFQLRWWGLADAALLALLAAWLTPAAGEKKLPLVRALALGALTLLCVAGAIRHFPKSADLADNTLSLSQAQGILERDFAHWLARRGAPGQPPLVHATPAVTTSLVYYGGLRGLGTRSWESSNGLALAVRVAISTSRDETLTLLRGRGVTHLVMASYDPFFDGHTQASSMQVGELFYNALHRWSLPSWLRPLPYPSPSIPGIEKNALRVFEVVEDQGEPLAAARLTEYFVELGELDAARASRARLLRYPGDLGVAIARAQLEVALQDAGEFQKIFEQLLARLNAGADRTLNWERRVALGVVLARGNRLDLAQAQIKRCLTEANEPRLRTLTNNGAFYLVFFQRKFGLVFPSPELERQALDYLTPEQRQSWGL